MASLCLQRAATCLAASAVRGQRCFSTVSVAGSARVTASLHSSQAPKGLGLASPLLPLRSSRVHHAGSPPRSHVAATRNISQATTDTAQLRGAKEAVKELIKSKYCNPILVRLGWHDSGTYDKDAGDWPVAGGATGSIRFKPEIEHGANAGLAGAIKLLEPIKEKFPAVSYADLFQLASAAAIEVAGGPKVPLRFGRVDAPSAEYCTPDGRLPDAAPPSPAQHLRNVFYRMGLNDKEIVALSGAHTLGRSHPERSGFGKESTKYTKDGPGSPGGSSWTVDWLVFDNSYFKEVKAKRDSELLVLPTDAVLFEDPEFKKYAEKYAEDQDAFFKDYAAAHKKLSELGSKFDPPQGVYIDAIYVDDDDEDYNDNKMSDALKAKLKEEYLGFGGSPDQPLKSNPFLLIIVGIAFLAVLSWLTGAI